MPGGLSACSGLPARPHRRGEGKGVRILSCPLPTKSPWLNPIEPRWAHAKRNVVEAHRLLSCRELAQRACDHSGCAYEEHPALTENVADVALGTLTQLS